MSSKENFIDFIRLHCVSGKGGAGSVHFLRNKLTSKGGPDGGDGGRGGHIILKGNKQLWTLLHLRYHKNIVAEPGEHGAKNNCTGKNGKDIIIEVPLGTIARDELSQNIDVEILAHNQEHVWLAGGRGGWGNINFATPTNQVPTYAQPGELGLELSKSLELKILADLGIIGFPNAGKSTLLSTISNAKPKIANYPFTTLTPQLGMVAYKNNTSFCVADIPGIIEGAAAGKGLGVRFLRHIERNAALLFLISAESEDIAHEFNLLRNELKKFNPELLKKNYLIVINKMDIVHFDNKNLNVSAYFKKKHPLHFVSAATQFGLEALKDKMWGVISS